VTWPVVEALQRLPGDLLSNPELAVPDTFLAAHIRLYAHRMVDTSLPGPGEVPGQAWLWGGLRKEEPAWAGRVSLETGHRPQWVSARRGKAQYWIGWLR
jgi:hypothetical protein